jgi:tRNA (guanosine-2'-O-)-methyltransferase
MVGDDDEDSRKTDDMIHVPSSGELWETVNERETAEDCALQEDFERRHKLWQNLHPELVRAATDILRPYVQEDRVARIEQVLQQRTKQTRFLFENPSNPSNVWACLRTLDSFGIQNVDVIVQSGLYKGKAALSQKRGMRTAMGSAKWLSLRNHLTTDAALRTIKEEGYHILCTDVNPSSKDVREVDWDGSGKPICIVMGNEQSGISPAVREAADESFYLPMVGFAESFNLSVATAITLAHLSASSKCESNEGPLRAGDLSERDRKTLLLKGYLNSVNHKTARALFRANGLQFPKDLNLS